MTIKKAEAEVYNDEDKSIVKPPVGYKLNIPAIITFKALGNQKKTLADNITAFRKAFDHPGDSEFVDYNAATRDVSFKVFHFTKYGFKDEESEQQQAQDGDMQSEQFESEQASDV